MKKQFDVAVVGGGVIGLACAWRLAQRGAKVALFERNKLGGEASHAAAGMLAPLCEIAVHSAPGKDGAKYSARRAFEQLCLHSRSLYADFAAELLNVTGVDAELSLIGAPTQDFRKPGILLVHDEVDDENDGVAEVLARQSEGVESAQWNGRNAFWLPNEGQVENRRLVTALAAACQISGVTIHENCEVQKIAVGKTETACGEIFCGKTLLAAGAWSSALLPNTPDLLRPVAGEVLAARGERTLSHIVYSRNVYLVPRRDGRVLIGATMCERGFDKSVTQSAREELLQKANILAPGFDWQVEDHWAGFRPATPDGLPVLGAAEYSWLHLALGHYRNGILLTPATAELMCENIMEGKSAPEEFSVARFTETLQPV